jgi:transposase
MLDQSYSFKTDQFMTRPYSIALKQQLVARLTGVNALSAAQLARETGITQQNLSRWLSEARSSPFGGDGIVSAWTVAQKARIIAQAADLGGDQLTTYLHGEGVKLGYFRRWRLALEEAGEESVGMVKRIRKLEQELARKERALAEAAALLLLRETMESENQKGDEGIDEQVEEEDELDRSIPTGAALAENPTPSSSIADFMQRKNAPFAKGQPIVDEPRSAGRG